MREPERLLSRLNAVGVDWQNVSAATGDVLTSVDIAATLAGLAKGPYLLMRYLWCGDKTVGAELVELLLADAIQIAHKQQWGCKHNLPRLSALVKMAIHEMEKINLCKSCKGTGMKMLESCCHCDGVGKKQRTQAEYARYCGVDPSNWQRRWSKKYEKIYLHAVTWNDIGINHMLSRL
ncbi:MAG: hypothetical protein U1E78_11785 [Gammaproteobacteria bacterium]